MIITLDTKSWLIEVQIIPMNLVHNDIHNLDCSQTCISSWQVLAEGVGAEDVLLAAAPIGG